LIIINSFQDYLASGADGAEVDFFTDDAILKQG